jgi:hypothetical protein
MDNLIVGIYSTTPGAGKTTVANSLIKKGFFPIKFAGCLKNMLRTCLVYQGVAHNIIERMIEGDLKETPSEYLLGKTPRHAMQTLGTEWGRDLIGKNMWLNTTQMRINSNPLQSIVIDDLRFPNEYEFLRSQNRRSILIEVRRKNAVTNTTHISEGSLANHTFDAVFINDPETHSAESFAQFVVDTILPQRTFYAY